MTGSTPPRGPRLSASAGSGTSPPAWPESSADASTDDALVPEDAAQGGWLGGQTGGAEPTGVLDARRADSREALLVAARQLFAEHGYDRTTMRAVAARASVDPALIYHYFPGGKRALLAETLTLPTSLVDLVSGVRAPADHMGFALIRRALEVWDGHQEVREQGVALIRIAVASHTAGNLLRPALQGFVQATLGDALREDDRELRSALVLTQIQGVLLHRYVLRIAPMAGLAPETIVATVGPVLQHYITGDLGAFDPPG